MQICELPVSRASDVGGATSRRWTRLPFRSVCLYLVLFHLDTLLGVIGSQIQQTLYRAPLRAFDGWIGAALFRLNPGVLRAGWGGGTDTLLYAIHAIDLLLVSALGAIVWSIVDTRRSSDERLQSWARLLVRYSLAASLFTYGFAKIFAGQMAPVWMFMSRWVEPFGNMSPAGLLWAFIGYSTPYQIFGGIAEVVPAMLLLFRRTATLGALLAVGVLANVVMLNFSYQIDVKVFSLNLLAAAIFLAAPAVPRLVRLFVLNQAAEPSSSDATPFDRQSLRRLVAGVQVVFVAWFLYHSVPYHYGNALLHPPTTHPALLGLYDVETFVQNGAERPPLATDRVRWKTVDIDYSPTVMQVQLMDESFRPYTVEYDPTGRSISVFPLRDKSRKYVLASSRPDTDHVVLEGKLGDDAVTIRLKRIDPSRFSLLNSQFHWTGRTDIH